MNRLIEDILETIVIDGKKIPYEFLKFNGKSDIYITYQEINSEPSFYSEDMPQYKERNFDIDIYSKGNYTKIVKEIKKKFMENGFNWQGDGADELETDTGYYHKSMEFSKEEMI